jgi:hypothetical protein
MRTIGAIHFPMYMSLVDPAKPFLMSAGACFLSLTSIIHAAEPAAAPQGWWPHNAYDTSLLQHPFGPHVSICVPSC